jgi:hypothetical protein
MRQFRKQGQDTADLEITSSRNAPRTKHGKVYLRSVDDLDGRTLAAKRTRQLVANIVTDLGGEENTTAGQRELVKHAAVLGAFIEDHEAAWIAGEKIPLDTYLAAVNAQRRLLRTIGLERKQRDVTPTADGSGMFDRVLDAVRANP